MTNCFEVDTGGHTTDKSSLVRQFHISTPYESSHQEGVWLAMYRLLRSIQSFELYPDCLCRNPFAGAYNFLDRTVDPLGSSPKQWWILLATLHPYKLSVNGQKLFAPLERPLQLRNKTDKISQLKKGWVRWVWGWRLAISFYNTSALCHTFGFRCLRLSCARRIALFSLSSKAFFEWPKLLEDDDSFCSASAEASFTWRDPVMLATDIIRTSLDASCITTTSDVGSVQ